MMPGPTLGNNAPEDRQQLFDALQEDIALFGEDERLKNLGLHELQEVSSDLTSFSLAVRDGSLINGQIISQLENFAMKGLHALNQVSEADFQKSGTNLKFARGALIKHIRKIAKRFGLQIELSNRIDLWEKSHPRTESTEEHTFQEQRDAAFKEVDAQFSGLYKLVTPKFGFESDIILGIMLDDFMIAKTPAIAAFLSVTDGAELKKRRETLKAKLKPMLIEALQKDARKATKVVFEKLAQEKYPTDESVKGLTALTIADLMISNEISERCKIHSAEFADYQALVYYWSSDPNEYRDIVELRKALIYLANEKWGDALRSDKRTVPDVEKAKRLVGQNTDLFFGGFAAAAAFQPEPPTRREGQGALPADNGETPAAEEPSHVTRKPRPPIHDIDELRAQLAARSAASGTPATQPEPAVGPEQQSVSLIAKPAVSRVPTKPVPKEKVIAEGGIPAEDPSKRRTLPEGRLAQAAATAAMGEAPTVLAEPAIEDPRKAKTDPPQASRPQRPDIQISRRDSEITETKTSERKKAERRSSWFNRGMLAVVAVLGIGGIYAAYKASQNQESTDRKTASANAANSNQATNVAPTATAAETASAAPTVADNQNPAPTSNTPKVSAPKVDPDAPKAAPEIASVLSNYSYGMGMAKGAKAFTGTASMFEGGVDATPFVASVKPASWNEAQQKSADVLMKIYDSNKSRLDKDTVNFITTHEKMLRDLAAQTDFKPWSFKKGFESHYASGDLFGANGVYNLLLGLQRITDLFGGDAEKLLKDKADIKLTVGGKVNAPEQRFAKAVLYKTAAAPGVPNGNPGDQKAPDDKGGQPQNNPQTNPGKSGFNQFIPGFNGGFTAPGMIPTDVVPANFPMMPKSTTASTFGFIAPQESSFSSPRKITTGQKLRIATDAAPAKDVAPLESDNLETAFNALNNSEAVKASDKKEAREYQVAKEVQQFVANEDQKLFDFEQKRRSRSFFTKLSDAASYIWSGTTPEDKEQGLKGIGGIRGLFMSDKQRQAEFNKRAEALEAMERKASLAKLMEAQALRAKQLRTSAPVIEAQPVSAPETVAAQPAPTKKEVLRAELDAKMEKLFAKAKAQAAERGPAPLINIRKNYTVKKEDKSIRFVLERQIKLSDLSDEAKQAALTEVHAMIQTNGDFIESYKMYPDGSRDLVLKDKYIARLNKAAGINIVPQNGETELPMAA